MGDRVKALRRENDDLKRQLNDLKKEFQSIKSKMAEQKNRTHRMSNSSATATMPLLSQNRACQKLWKIFLVGWIYWQLTLTELTKLSMRCSTTVTNITWRSWASHLSQKANLHKTPRSCVWSYFLALESMSPYQRFTLPTGFHSEILQPVMATENNRTW